MGEWQDIATAPTNATSVLVYYANLTDWPGVDPVRAAGWRIAIGWFNDGEWFESGTAHNLFEPWLPADQYPTHWMPLPQPPVQP